MSKVVVKLYLWALKIEVHITSTCHDISIFLWFSRPSTEICKNHSLLRGCSKTSSGLDWPAGLNLPKTVFYIITCFLKIRNCSSTIYFNLKNKPLFQTKIEELLQSKQGQFHYKYFKLILLNKGYCFKNSIFRPIFGHSFLGVSSQIYLYCHS